MAPPLLSVEGGGGGGGGHSHVSLLAPPTSMDLSERNYLGLNDGSSSAGNMNMKATELRLGLPGSQSPEREQDHGLDEKQLFPLLPSKEGICSSAHKMVFSGSKRGFSDAMEGNWMFHSATTKTETPQSMVPKVAAHAPINVMVSPKGNQPATAREAGINKTQEKNVAVNCSSPSKIGASNNSTNPPATKALVVGWPPIRSFRKNTLASTSKSNDEVDGKPGPGALFVKVSMDGAPYLRKVDLRSYSSYQELSSALEKMFSCFTIGQYGSHGASGKETMSATKLKDLLHGSEYVLTYEDKDSDWMLVGDVPWEMFIDTCRKLKIMKSSDAIGLAAPRGSEKSKNTN